MIKEVDIAAAVVAWLENEGWDVYQEVEPMAYDYRADIVGQQGQLLWVVECKTSLSLAVMEQAAQWTHRAHLTSVAVPQAKTRSHRFSGRILEHFGIGLLICDDSDIYQSLVPRLVRHKKNPLTTMLREALVPQRKTFAPAGNPNSLRWTPYAETCRLLAERVRNKPGITIKDAIDGMRHHYRTDITARSCLTKWLSLGKVRGVKAIREGRKYTLYPAESQ